MYSAATRKLYIPIRLGAIIHLSTPRSKVDLGTPYVKLTSMYIAVDIGGTKTLLAVFSSNGEVKEEIKFPTPRKYEDFLNELARNVDKLATKDFRVAAVAAPGRIDREHGIGISFGNLGWKNISIAHDIEKIIHTPVMLENDAKLGGLSEAKNLEHTYKRVLYLTISTGIGIALIVNGVIDTAIGDRGGRALLLEHKGSMKAWEEFASGKAIVKRYGKRASEIDDPKIWKIIAHDFAVGFIDLIAVLNPEVIVVGGGVGTHFLKYKSPLLAELKSYETPMLTIPPIQKALRPEKAVIYGCYELAKAHHESIDKTA